MKELLRVEVSHASKGDIIPLCMIYDVSWQNPDYMNDFPEDDTELQPEIVSKNGNSIKKLEIDGTVYKYTDEDLTWENLDSLNTNRDDVHLKLKSNWCGLSASPLSVYSFFDFDTYQKSYLTYEMDHNGLFGKDTLLEGWEDTFCKIAKDISEKELKDYNKTNNSKVEKSHYASLVFLVTLKWESIIIGKGIDEGSFVVSDIELFQDHFTFHD